MGLVTVLSCDKMHTRQCPWHLGHGEGPADVSFLPDPCMGNPRGLSSEAEPSAALRAPRTRTFLWDPLGHSVEVKEMMNDPVEGLVFPSLVGGVSSIHFQSHHGCKLHGQAWQLSG